VVYSDVPKIDVTHLTKGGKRFDPNQRRDAAGRWAAVASSVDGVGAYFADASLSNQKAWIKEHSKRYSEDEEFQVVADAITFFTQGEYGAIREMAKYEMTGKWSAKYADSSIPDWYENNKRMWGWIKPYFPGQKSSGDSDVVRSKHSYREAAEGLTKAIASAPPVSGSLYRGLGVISTHDKLKEFLDMKPGDVIAMPAPSSFTTSKEIAENIAKGSDPGFQLKRDQPNTQVIVEVEPGARGIHAGALSPWKQEEVISSGKFEVTGKEVQEISLGAYKKRTIIRVKMRQVAVWELNTEGKKAVPAIAYDVLDQPDWITNMFDEPWFPSEVLSVLGSKTWDETQHPRGRDGRFVAVDTVDTSRSYRTVLGVSENNIDGLLGGFGRYKWVAEHGVFLCDELKEEQYFGTKIVLTTKSGEDMGVIYGEFFNGVLYPGWSRVNITGKGLYGRWLTSLSRHMTIRSDVGDNNYDSRATYLRLGAEVDEAGRVYTIPKGSLSRIKANPYKDDKGRFTFKPNAAPEQPAEATNGAIQFLTLVGNMMQGNYQGEEAIFNVDLALAEHGTVRSDVQKGNPRMKPKMCFNNSITRSIQDGSTYTEGKVFVHGFPIAHAWNTHEDGTAKDHTITDPERWTYVGLKVPPQTLATIVTSKHFGKGIYDGVLGTVNAFPEAERKKMIDEIIAFNSQTSTQSNPQRFNKAKRAGLQPAGSLPGDEEIILALIKMGLTRAEARRYLALSRQKRD
jgi:hypothetical protein